MTENSASDEEGWPDEEGCASRQELIKNLCQQQYIIEVKETSLNSVVIAVILYSERHE